MNFQEELLDERTLMSRKPSRKSGTMPIPGSEGAARKDVARAGFRRKGPIQEPEVEKSGKDVPVWVRTHKSPAEYAAHTSKQKHQEGEKVDAKELKKQFHQTGAKKDTEVHDITVGSPKSKVKEPGQRARQFVGALKDVAGKMKEKKGVATNTPTAISSSGKKRKRSDEEGAEQRGRIYKKLGMGERNPKTGVQMAKLGEGKTFAEFMLECYSLQEKSLSRVVSKIEKGGIAIISAARGDLSNKENRRRSKQLDKNIRGAGLPGPTNVKGAYHEKGHGEVTEPSKVVSSGKKGKKKWKKLVTKLGQEGGLKHKRNQKPDSQKRDQDSALIKQKPGLKTRASWLGTSRRSDADPKLGKKVDQGTLSTKNANSPLKPGEGATIVGKKKLQFK